MVGTPHPNGSVLQELSKQIEKESVLILQQERTEKNSDPSKVSFLM